MEEQSLLIGMRDGCLIGEVYLSVELHLTICMIDSKPCGTHLALPAWRPLAQLSQQMLL